MEGDGNWITAISKGLMSGFRIKQKGKKDKTYINGIEF